MFLLSIKFSFLCFYYDIFIIFQVANSLIVNSLNLLPCLEFHGLLEAPQRTTVLRDHADFIRKLGDSPFCATPQATCPLDCMLSYYSFCDSCCVCSFEPAISIRHICSNRCLDCTPKPNKINPYGLLD